MGIPYHCLGSLSFLPSAKDTFYAKGINPYEFQGTLIYPKTLKQFISLSDLHQIAQIFFLRDRKGNSDFSMFPE
jgi:hypothetical protein